MNLSKQLNALKEANLSRLPKDLSDVLLKDVERQVKNGITKNALKVGDQIPAFELQNAVGEMVKSTDLLYDGPLIISFYRGAWCPYCNVELAAYQESLEEIKEAGAQLVAISPDLPDKSMSLVEKHALQYEILSDINNKTSREFGLVYPLGKDVQNVYEKFGIDLENHQGNTDFELPFAATYVVDSNGSIIEAAVNYDYTVRLDPADAIEIIKTCTY